MDKDALSKSATDEYIQSLMKQNGINPVYFHSDFIIGFTDSFRQRLQPIVANKILEPYEPVFSYFQKRGKE